MSQILLVEDSPTQAMQMKMLLETASHDVICCEDGATALQQLRDGTSELVITDLELPEMSGLELIQRMGADFPQIPAVLITSQGSERLAAEALRNGATAYVPKSAMQDLLLGTVEDVLGVARTDRSYAELIDCTLENRMLFELPSRMESLTTAIDLTMQMAAGMRLLTGVERYRVATALQHAASNAIYRGNFELTREQWRHAGESGNVIKPCSVAEARSCQAPYQKRRVRYDAKLTRQAIEVSIRDDGTGFAWRELKPVGDPQALEPNQGRGLLLIRQFMDHVSFNEAGNEITVIKEIRPQLEAR